MDRRNFNGNWIFYSKENPENKIQVRLPHDAMQTEERIPNLKNGALVGFYPGGDYYYEKNLFGEKELENKTVILDFGGVFMDSHVYLNGVEVGGHVYGYSNFYVDLTDKVKIGEDNLIQVFAHNSQVPNSRWYSGSGIYCPVYLLIGNREHINCEGVRITTESCEPAVIKVEVEGRWKNNVKIKTEILWEKQVVAYGEGVSIKITIPDANLWDEFHPNLYSYRVRLQRNGEDIDTAEGTFGIRSLEWNSSQGLVVNGKSVKLRGACIHHDNGILGAVENKAVALRKIRRLKEGGFNAVRGAHNPRTREILEACDELGMYVMEEFFDGWYTSGVYGYALYFEKEWEQDVELAVRKCYNHPSVVLYSIGNEVSETADEKGIETAKKIVSRVHSLDTSRPVTMGVNLMMNVMYRKGVKLGGQADNTLSIDDVVDPKATGTGMAMDGSVLFNFMISLFAAGPFIKAMSKPRRSDGPIKGICEVLDIAGYNYGEESYKKHHEMYPERIMLGTETKALNLKKRMKLVNTLPSVIGDFVWTGWDYLGECGLGIIDYNKNTGGFTKPFPVITAGCGLYDIIGHRETMAYDMAIAWGQYDKPFISVSHPKHAKDRMIKSMYRTTDAIDCWTFPGYEGVKTMVRIAGTGKKTELFLNGKSCGKKKLKDYHAFFNIPYVPGEIKAVTYDENGKKIAENNLITARKETCISVWPDRWKLAAGGDDMCFLEAAFTDKDGIYKPLEEKIYVKVEGAAILMAVGSGNPRTVEKYTGDSFTTYNGRMAAVIRSLDRAGEIRVTFSASGYQEKQIILEAV